LTEEDLFKDLDEKETQSEKEESVPGEGSGGEEGVDISEGSRLKTGPVDEVSGAAENPEDLDESVEAEEETGEDEGGDGVEFEEAEEASTEEKPADEESAEQEEKKED
jgi:hypothetical protein